MSSRSTRDRLPSRASSIAGSSATVVTSPPSPSPYCAEPGVPSRARCGFGGYFEPGKWIDHWIVEHRDGTRWVRLDPQIDDFQRKVTGLNANPADLPPGRFLTGGEAWLACQAGDEDPEQFGILDMWGSWFIRGNLVRDIASLNKVEMLPWDVWGVLAVAMFTLNGPTAVDVIELA